MKNSTHIHVMIDECQRGILTLQRPEKHNAFDEVLIQDLIEALDFMSSNPQLRCLVLQSEGKSFSAGADLDWMKRMAKASAQENEKDAFQLAILLEKLAMFPLPTIAFVQGSAYGGGVGLLSCCDIVIAHESAKFALTEVKFGIIAATIMPYVVKAIGERQAKRYALSAESITALKALEIGLVHEVCGDDFKKRSLEILEQIELGARGAHIETKKLIFDLPHLRECVKEETAKRIAERRASLEAKEGLSAFLEKRQPSWVK